MSMWLPGDPMLPLPDPPATPGPETARLTAGVVATVDPLTVYLEGAASAVAARALDCGALYVGETVMVLLQDGDVLVLGTRDGDGLGRPQAKVIRATNQSIASASFVGVSFSAAHWDTGAMWNGSTILQASRPGIYGVTAGARWANTAAGIRVARIVMHDASAGTEHTIATSVFPSGGDVEHSLAGEVFLDDDDYVYLGVFQASAGALNIDATSLPGIPYLTARLVG